MRELLQDELPGLPGILAFAGIAFLGVFLAADFVVTGCLYLLYGVCFALSFVFAAIVRVISAACGVAFARRPASAKPQAAPKFDVPIQHTGFEVKPEPIVEPEAVPDEPAVLPITRLGMANLPEENFDNYELPPMTLLDDPEPFPFEQHDQKLRDQATILEKTFKDFDLNVRVVGINTGPVITQYEVALETGLRVNKITTLGDDLALHLKVPERPHRRADSRQEHRRHRGPQRASRHGSPQGSHPRRRAQARQVQGAAVPRQGHRRQAARLRPGRHAAPAHRRHAPARANRCA